MSLEPRIRSASEENPGVVCCSANDLKHRCPKCQAFAATGKRTLRSAEDFSPPDPYAPGLARQRAINDAKHPPLTIAPPLEIHYDERGVPDPYFNELQKLRSNR